MRGNFVLSAYLAGSLAFSVACDSTIGLDPTRSDFTEVLVPGVCPASNNLSSIDVSVLMLKGPSLFLPDDHLTRESKSIEELIRPEDFSFKRPQGASAGQTEEAFIEPEVGSGQTPIALQPDSINFQWSGGESRKDDRKLVVFLMDDSGSLIGEDARTMMVDLNNASDKDDERISFFDQLVKNLPKDYFLSIVSFSGSFPKITAMWSTPTQNREVIGEGFAELSRGSTGLTPLADACVETVNRVIDNSDSEDLNPVIVMFTDGVEEGDSSSSNTLSDCGDALTAGGRSIPIIILHLQPKASSMLPRGRNAEFADLACKTGGEYIFLERASEFTANSDLSKIVANRLIGSWRLRTNTTLPSVDAGSYLLSTELSVTLGSDSQPVGLVKTRGGQQINDTRLWLKKN